MRRRLIAWRPPRSSILDAPPPSTISPENSIGDYTIKATVEANGETYMGYGQDLGIAVKTRYVCERMGKGCQDPEITFMGGKCDEVILVRHADGTLTKVG
tara:strand:+ start:1922 stop:2221 length:300 start_codon:yes stop_codon:yes gene_type:complete